jgi:hypothetical protein
MTTGFSLGILRSLCGFVSALARQAMFSIFFIVTTLFLANGILLQVSNHFRALLVASGCFAWREKRL